MACGKKALIFFIYLFLFPKQMSAMEQLVAIWYETPSWVKYGVPVVLGGYYLWDLYKKNIHEQNTNHRLETIENYLTEENKKPSVGTVVKHLLVKVDALEKFFNERIGKIETNVHNLNEQHEEMRAKITRGDRDLNQLWRYVYTPEKILEAQNKKQSKEKKSALHPRPHVMKDSTLIDLLREQAIIKVQHMSEVLENATNGDFDVIVSPRGHRPVVPTLSLGFMKNEVSALPPLVDD